MNAYSRSQLILGDEAIDKLIAANVIVFGVGGVGSYCIEALVRGGLGNITIVDHDRVSITNINRQLIATYSTIGQYKVDVMKKRILEINPNCNVKVYKTFYGLHDEAIDLSQYTYIVDAIDTISAKLLLIEQARDKNIPIISAMGAGNKLDPTQFEVSDIFSTSMCPLAKTMRNELRKRAIKSLKVVYSKEKPIKPSQSDEASLTRKRQVPGSVSFVPPVAGLIIAGEVIKDIKAQILKDKGDMSEI